MSNIFISRKQYDRMITLFSGFMATTWTKLKSKWSLAGVSVTVNDEYVAADIRRMLKICEAN